MMNEWKEVKLGDVCEIIGGGTPKTTIEEYWNGNIPWITPKDLSNFSDRYISKGERMITDIGLKNSAAKLIPKGSILFTTRAPIGYIAISKNDVCTNQGFKSLVYNKTTNNVFLYYLLKYRTEDIKSIGSGTTFMEVSGTTMKNFVITLPPLPEQKAIADTLSCLDDKIELNNKINKNLEAQAQAIFKSWFVDFEPFQDGEFVDSELGRIPKGWRVGTLGEVVKSIDNRGKTPPLSEVKTNYPIIDVKALSGESRIINYSDCTKHVHKSTYETWFRSGHPQYLDILISTVGSLAEMKLFLGNIGCIAQNVVGLRCLEISPLYIYQYLKFIRQDLIAYNIGSVQPSIKVTHIIKQNILLPNKVVLEQFHRTLNVITEQIFINSIENQTLITLRDTLLPKLMSGEIRVPMEVE